MSEPSTCMKCGGRLTEGFVVDQGYGVVDVSTWQGGAPQKSFWSGIKTDKSAQLPITTYRCQRCGYLEQYARQS